MFHVWQGHAWQCSKSEHRDLSVDERISHGKTVHFMISCDEFFHNSHGPIPPKIGIPRYRVLTPIHHHQQTQGCQLLHPKKLRAHFVLLEVPTLEISVLCYILGGWCSQKMNDIYIYIIGVAIRRSIGFRILVEIPSSDPLHFRLLMHRFPNKKSSPFKRVNLSSRDLRRFLGDSTPRSCTYSPPKVAPIAKTSSCHS